MEGCIWYFIKWGVHSILQAQDSQGMNHIQTILLLNIFNLSSAQGAIIQYPGEGGGGWIFCRGKIIYFNPARRRAENF